MLVEYLRNEERKPFGVVVALGRDTIGVSLCCPKDHFNKSLGKTIAHGRAIYGSHLTIPRRKEKEVNAAIARMKQRAERYYKG